MPQLYLESLANLASSAQKSPHKFLHDGDLVEVDADKGVVRIIERVK